jgi:hypothetical protein
MASRKRKQEAGSKGAKGTRGPQGKRGLRGERGLQGRRGPVGRAGKRGRKGVRGPHSEWQREMLRSIEERFDDVYRQLDIQLKRISQIQADIDRLTRRVLLG